MKPTAKAATTVVSTPPLIGSAPRPGGGRPRGSSGGGRSALGRGAVAPPAPQRVDDAARRRAARAATGTSQSALRSRGASGRRARPRRTRSTSAALICGLSLPAAICAADERALLVGDGRVGDAQRRAALDAHHLVLDVGQRGARRRGRAGAAKREHQRERASASLMTAPRAASAAAGRATPGRPGSAAARRRGPGGRSGTSPGSRSRRTRARRSGRGRAGSGTSPCASRRKPSASAVASCVSMPSTTPPWAAIFSCVFWSSGTSSRHGGHHDAHMFSTTTLPL